MHACVALAKKSLCSHKTIGIRMEHFLKHPCTGAEHFLRHQCIITEQFLNFTFTFKDHFLKHPFTLTQHFPRHPHAVIEDCLKHHDGVHVHELRRDVSHHLAPPPHLASPNQNGSVVAKQASDVHLGGYAWWKLVSEIYFESLIRSAFWGGRVGGNYCKKLTLNHSSGVHSGRCACWKLFSKIYTKIIK